MFSAREVTVNLRGFAWFCCCLLAPYLCWLENAVAGRSYLIMIRRLFESTEYHGPFVVQPSAILGISIHSWIFVSVVSIQLLSSQNDPVEDHLAVRSSHHKLVQYPYLACGRLVISSRAYHLIHYVELAIHVRWGRPHSPVCSWELLRTP